MWRKLFVLGVAVCLSAPAQAAISLRSGPERVSVIELYTAEGCSSCPRADQWFSTLKHSKDLWKKVVPLGFHVNYWDRLGWKDRLSSADYTARQQAYAGRWNLDRVYTPMFVQNGREFREDYKTLSNLPKSTVSAGTLEAVQTARQDFEVRYRPADGKGDWLLHSAILGFNVKTHVTAGENNRRDLVHDFAVLSHETRRIETQDGTAMAVVRFPERLPVEAKLKAVAFWISAGDDPTPVQALGGFLSKEDS